MKRCKGCGFPQIDWDGKKIWLSEDGYCSVCNFKIHREDKNLKKRTRMKRIWEYDNR